MLQAFEIMDLHMLKLHLLHCHLDFFKNQLAIQFDEQGEKFHQTILEMEQRYQWKRLDSILADFCWSIAYEY